MATNFGWDLDFLQSEGQPSEKTKRDSVKEKNSIGNENQVLGTSKYGIMIMIMKFLFPCYKFRYYSRSRIYYKYNTEANEDRKMSPTLAGSHLSVLMCLHCNA